MRDLTEEEIKARAKMLRGMLDEEETEHLSDTIALEKISRWWFISATFSDEESAYNLVRDELQLATTGYLTNSSHGDPIVIG